MPDPIFNILIVAAMVFAVVFPVYGILCAMWSLVTGFKTGPFFMKSFTYIFLIIMIPYVIMVAP